MEPKIANQGTVRGNEQETFDPSTAMNKHTFIIYILRVYLKCKGVRSLMLAVASPGYKTGDGLVIFLSVFRQKGLGINTGVL